MGQKEWARTEIDRAIKNENPEYKPITGFNKKVCNILNKWHVQNDKRPKRFRDSFDYGCACYESAYKAFCSLCDDGHSGASFGFTKQILERLMDGNPLTPIDDIPENWKPCMCHDDKYSTYQCSRMSSLFKTVQADGTVSYDDIDRVIGVSPSGGCFHAGYLRDYINELDPIVLPYSGTTKPYYVYTQDFLSDEKRGDFDTVQILHMIKPDGTKVMLDKYMAESDNGFIDISYLTFQERVAAHKKRIKNNK